MYSAMLIFSLAESLSISHPCWHSALISDDVIIVSAAMRSSLVIVFPFCLWVTGAGLINCRFGVTGAKLKKTFHPPSGAKTSPNPPPKGGMGIFAPVQRYNSAPLIAPVQNYSIAPVQHY